MSSTTFPPLKKHPAAPSGAFVLNNSARIEGGLAEGSQFGLNGQPPTLVFVIPLESGETNIQLVFNTPEILFALKRALVSMDMAALYPKDLVATECTPEGTVPLNKH